MLGVLSSLDFKYLRSLDSHELILLIADFFGSFWTPPLSRKACARRDHAAFSAEADAWALQRSAVPSCDSTKVGDFFEATNLSNWILATAQTFSFTECLELVFPNFLPASYPFATLAPNLILCWFAGEFERSFSLYLWTWHNFFDWIYDVYLHWITQKIGFSWFSWRLGMVGWVRWITQPASTIATSSAAACRGKAPPPVSPSSKKHRDFLQVLFCTTKIDYCE